MHVKCAVAARVFGLEARNPRNNVLKNSVGPACPAEAERGELLKCRTVWQ